jgi:hypothetical protein
MWPNPAKDELNIHWAASINGPVYITDNAGRMAMTVPVSGKSVTIQLSKLKPGLYFLKSPVGVSAFQVIR